MAFEVSKKADALFPIVSAASIAAKVTRDALIESWEEAGRAEAPRGSGYPSDPKTKAYIRTMVDPIFGLPAIARHSWSTAQEAMAKFAAPVAWSASSPLSWKGEGVMHHVQGGRRGPAEGEGQHRRLPRRRPRNSAPRLLQGPRHQLPHFMVIFSQMYGACYFGIP